MMMVMMMVVMVMMMMMCHWISGVSLGIPTGVGECNNVWPLVLQYDILYKRYCHCHHHHHQHHHHHHHHYHCVIMCGRSYNMKLQKMISDTAIVIVIIINDDSSYIVQYDILNKTRPSESGLSKVVIVCNCRIAFSIRWLCGCKRPLTHSIYPIMCLHFCMCIDLCVYIFMLNRTSSSRLDRPWPTFDNCLIFLIC